MGFAQELKDFASGFKTGFDIADKFTGATDAAKDRREQAKADAKANRERDGIAAEENNVRRRASGDAPETGGAKVPSTDYESTERSKALAGVDRSDPGLYAEGGSGPDAGAGASGMGGREGVGDDGINRILTLVRADSGDNYNALTYKKDKTPGGEANLEGMTISEVYALQDKMRGTHASTAVGGYQTIHETLRSSVDRLGLDPTKTKFDRRTQDQIGADLVRQRGYDKFRAGEIDEATFGSNLAKEWAVLKGPNGKGAYDGFNGNKGSVGFEQVRGAIRGGERQSSGLGTKPDQTGLNSTEQTQLTWEEQRELQRKRGRTAFAIPEEEQESTLYASEGGMVKRFENGAWGMHPTEQAAPAPAPAQAIPTAPVTAPVTPQTAPQAAPAGTGGPMQAPAPGAPPGTGGPAPRLSISARFKAMREASAGRRQASNEAFKGYMANLQANRTTYKDPNAPYGTYTGRYFAEGGMVEASPHDNPMQGEVLERRDSPPEGRWANYYDLEDHPDMQERPEDRTRGAPLPESDWKSGYEGEDTSYQAERAEVQPAALPEVDGSDVPGAGKLHGVKPTGRNLRYGRGEQRDPQDIQVEPQQAIPEDPEIHNYDHGHDRGGENMNTREVAGPVAYPEESVNRTAPPRRPDVDGQGERAQIAAREMLPEYVEHDLPPSRPADLKAAEKPAKAPAKTAKAADKPAAGAKPVQAKAIPEAATETVTSQGYDTHDNSGGMHAGAVQSSNPVVNKIAEVARSTGNAEPIKAGMKYLNDQFASLQGGVPTPERQAAIAALAGGKNAPPVGDVVEAKNAVDGDEELTPDARMMVTLQAGYQYFMKQGQPDKAAKYAGELLMYSRAAVMKAGYMAQAALEKGDPGRAARLIAMARSEFPDGEGLKVGKPGEDGSVPFAMFDSSGKLTQRGRATADQIMSMATGMQNGSAWMDAMWERMGPKQAVDPSKKPMTPYQQERARQTDERLRLDREKLDVRRGGAPGQPAAPRAPGAGGGRSTQADRQAAAAGQQDEAEKGAISTNPNYDVKNAKGEVAAGPSQEVATELGKVDADRAYKGVAEKPAGASDRMDPEAYKPIDNALRGTDPVRQKKFDGLKPEQRFAMRGVVQNMMLANSMGVDEAAHLFNKAARPESNVQVRDGRLLVDGRPLILDRQSISTIAALRGGMGARQAPASAPAAPARREVSEESAAAVRIATRDRRRNMMDER
jgi:hypothetical protein